MVLKNKLMIKLLLLLALDSAQLQASKDTQFLCDLYKNEITFVKNCNNTDSIYKLEDSLDKQAACALIRLKKHNKEDYKPIDTYTSEGKGVAYLYPCSEVIEIKKFRRRKQSQEIDTVLFFDLKTGKLIE